ncbi:MAG: hypothetical protein HC905_27555 [Bacteroidales bacterium]|nr:hypothetical protein [Bacteroidales bacterium]
MLVIIFLKSQIVRNDNQCSQYHFQVAWFKKARQYFPDSKLLINDYDILNNYNNTVPVYRQLITLLKDSGLIDGIGLQGHFLESYSLEEIKKNLDSIATLNLPIYIAEFDLDIANDQSQKNKYEELFPLLWNHPLLKGFTFWGYKQGNIWRSNGYLKIAEWNKSSCNVLVN